MDFEPISGWLKTAVRIAKNPWTILFVMLFFIVAGALEQFVFEGKTLIEAVSWAWDAWASITERPLIILLLIVLAIACFFKGVESIQEEESATREHKEKEEKTTRTHKENLQKNATYLSVQLAQRDRIGTRVIKLDRYLREIKAKIGGLRNGLKAPWERQSVLGKTPDILRMLVAMAELVPELEYGEIPKFNLIPQYPSRNADNQDVYTPENNPDYVAAVSRFLVDCEQFLEPYTECIGNDRRELADLNRSITAETKRLSEI